MAVYTKATLRYRNSTNTSNWYQYIAPERWEDVARDCNCTVTEIVASESEDVQGSEPPNSGSGTAAEQYLVDYGDPGGYLLSATLSTSGVQTAVKRGRVFRVTVLDSEPNSESVLSTKLSIGASTLEVLPLTVVENLAAGVTVTNPSVGVYLITLPSSVFVTIKILFGSTLIDVVS